MASAPERPDLPEEEEEEEEQQQQDEQTEQETEQEEEQQQHTEEAREELEREGEELRILSECNPVIGDLPGTTLLEWGSALEPRRARGGQTAAVISGEASMSYPDLDAAADALAQALGGAGVATGAVVAICVPRTISLAVALLGVLKVCRNCAENILVDAL
jgi:non-ribosomal peptide synthetase component F